jgi:hypothetical protein
VCFIAVVCSVWGEVELLCIDHDDAKDMMNEKLFNLRKMSFFWKIGHRKLLTDCIFAGSGAMTTIYEYAQRGFFGAVIYH